MTNWEIARYLIDAKKEVDTLCFIAVNANKINGNLKRIIESHRNSFYINSATVVDKFIATKENKKTYKRTLCENNELINKLFYFRNKHSAHKDDDFKDTEYNSIMDIVKECMQIIKEVRIIASDVLPDSVTLNFVCYDQELFRNIYGISKEIEEKINYSKYPHYNEKIKIENPITKKIFNDTEDLWKVESKHDYCTILKNGLTMDESLQNRQDWCIKTNVLYGKDIWVTMNNNSRRACLMMIKMGYLDIFLRPKFINKTEEEYLSDIELINNAEKYNVFDFREMTEFRFVLFFNFSLTFPLSIIIWIIFKSEKVRN